MDKVMEKISSYEILNNVIPGTMYMICLERMTSFAVLTGQIWIDFVLFYFSGMIISRIGSIYIERFMKNKGMIKYTEYEEYVRAIKEDSGIQKLLTINNMYRTFIAVVLSVIVTIGIDIIWNMVGGFEWSKVIAIIICCIFLTIILARSFMKQTDYIVERIQITNQDK